MRRLLFAIAAVLILAACGGGDGGEPAQDTAPDTADTGMEQTAQETAAAQPPVTIEGEVNARGTVDATGQGSLEITAGDFFFDPTYVQTEPGASLTVTVTNEGSAAHTFTVDTLGIDETLEPGASIEVQVDLPEDGPVVYYCRFHEGQGMQGAFYFEAGQAEGTDGETQTGDTESPADTGY